MVKCVRHIAREPLDHEPIVLAWTRLNQSGHRFSCGSTNNPTSMPKICSSVCREACPASSRQGNYELSNGESNSGAVKSPASWCPAWNPSQKSTRKCASPAPLSIPTRCAHDQLAGFQIDQTRGEAGFCTRSESVV